MKAAEWIDRLKANRGWESDYRAAKELGLGRATVSKYRSNPESTMDDDTAVKVAEALHLDPELVVLDQVTERTRSEPARAALSGLLERIRGKALSGGGTVRRLDITSVTDTSATGELQAPRSTRYALCKPQMSALQLLARALTSALSTAPAQAFA